MSEYIYDMRDVVIGIIEHIGAKSLNAFAQLGRLAIFALSAISHIFRPPFYFGRLGEAIYRIGYASLPIVGLTALFTGGALALQIFEGGSRYNANEVVPFIVALGIVRELGPVLTGLMVAGRVSSSMAAEIATMRVTEQIDALVTLSTNPMKYLIAPRILAASLVMPILVAISDILGIFGGYLVGTTRLGFSSHSYLLNTVENLVFWDVASGLVKGLVFGFILSLMGVYYGYHSGRGAEGVGRATTNAVVFASIGILAANYLLTELFFNGG